MKLALNQFNRASSGVRVAVLAMLYPTACRICGAGVESWRDGLACGRCWEEGERKIERSRAENNFCLKCGMPLPELPPHIFIEERSCGRCNEMAFGFARAC